MKSLLQNLLLSSAVLAVSYVGVQSTIAAPIQASDRSQPADSTPRLLSQQMTQVSDTQDSDHEEPMSQVSSVSQLSDVKPTDWAFQSLQSLVERYGCIVGYSGLQLGRVQ